MRKSIGFLSCVLLSWVTGCSPSSISAANLPPSQFPLGPRVYKITMDSPSLRKHMKVSIYVPPDYNRQKRYPVLYVFHGKDGNADTWMNGWWGRSAVGIDKSATELIETNKIQPMIIVAPEIDNSYGINSSQTPSTVNGYSRGMYEDYFIKDLVPYIDQHYSTIADRSGRYVGGLSMGGFTALHDAFLHPDLFSKVGVMSAALWVGGPPAELSWLYPTPSTMETRDPISIAQRGKVHDVSADIIEGDSDPFVHADHALYMALQNDHVKVQYHLYPGAHDYNFWSHHAAELLLFFDTRSVNNGLQ